MSEKKHRVEVFFDEKEFAILKELSTGIESNIEKLVYDTVFCAHLTEEAKKRHAAICWILSQEPFDLESEWNEMKDWLAKDWAWKIIKSYDHDKGESQ